MQLTIQHFRCWDSVSYTFPQEAVILIRGRSGSGKSTLFKAILWALYGYGKKVAPFSRPDAKTAVSLTLNHMQLVRERRPNHLTVQVGDAVYHDDGAQSCIDKTCGTLDMFMASCYIEQGQRNSFFSMSKNERLSFLDDLVFHDEKPETYITKLKETRNSEEKNYSTRFIRYEVDLEHHNRDVASVEADITSRYTMSVADLLSMEEELAQAVASLSTKKAELKDKHERRERTCMELAFIEREIVVVSEPPCPSLLTSMDIDQIEQLDKKRQLADRLLELSSVELDELSVDLDVEEVRQVEVLRAANEKLCKTLSLPYTKNNVEDVLSSIQCQSYSVRVQLETEMSMLKEPTPPPDVGDLELLLTKTREEAVELERRTRVIVCPYCNGSLIYHDKLEPCSSTPISLHEKEKLASLKKDVVALEIRLAEQKKQLAAYRVANDRFIKRRAELATHLSVLKDVEKPKHKLPSHVDYRSLTFYEEPALSSRQLSLLLEKRALLKDLSMDDVHRIRVARPYLLAVKEYEKKEKEMREKRTRADLLRANLPDDVTHEYKVCCDTLKAKSLLLDAVKSLKDKLATIHHREDALNSEADKLSSLHSRIRHLSTLLDHAEALEAAMIEETVHALSLHINDIASVLFDVDIDMALSVHKTLKKKEKRIAPSFTISYKGNKYDSPSEMSGGEEERCSLAFTLAMNHFSPSPILLLDECLNSLDNKCKEIAVDTIRRRISGICLCIMHGDVDYMYDSVVDVDE